MTTSRRVLFAALAAVALAAGALWLLVELEVRLSLNALRGPITNAISEAIGRPVEISGDLSVIPALWPTLGAREVVIDNAPGFAAESFAELYHVRGSLGLMPLLRGDVVIEEIQVSGARLFLETDAEGHGNWIFDPQEPAETAPPSAGDAAGDEPDAGLLEVHAIRLDDVTIGYHEGRSGLDRTLVIDRLDAGFEEDEARLEILGAVEGQPVDLLLRSRPFRELLDTSKPWAVDVGGSVAGVPVAGRLDLDLGELENRAVVRIAAARSQLDGLAAMLRRDDIDGRFETLRLEATSHGLELASWAENLDAQLELENGALSYGNVSGERQVAFSVERASIAVSPGGPLNGDATVTLLGEPIQVEFEAGTARSYFEELPWPVALHLDAPRSQAKLTGLLGTPNGIETRLHLELSGERLGSLSSLLGTAASAEAPFSVSTDIVGGPDDLTLERLNASLGRSRIDGRLRLRREEEPLLEAVLHASNLDPEELAANLARPGAPTGPGLTLDAPILPSRLEILDIDADLSLDRIDAEPVPFERVAFRGRIRDAGVQDGPFSLRYGGLDFSGRLALDLDGVEQRLRAEVTTTDADVGAFARRLGLAEALDATARQFDVKFETAGSTLRQLLEGATLEASLKDGRWVIDDQSLDGSLRVAVDEARILGRPGEPLAMQIEGSVDEQPVHFVVETDSFEALLVADQEDFPIRVHARSKAAELILAARVALPIRRGQTGIDVELRGESLADLEPLLALELPPFGPYALRGTLDASPGRYATRFELDVRKSRLNGQVAMRAVDGRPVFEVELDAETIQLRDFDLTGWSPIENPSQADAPRDAVTTAQQTEALLSKEFLAGFDAHIVVDVGAVRSGEDALGSGSLVADIGGGRLTVDPLALALPGGDAQLAFAIEPGDGAVKSEVRARIEKLDYGIIARRLTAGNETAGLISLDVDLRSEAPTLDRALAGATGIVDAAIWPENYQTGALRLWAVNLFRATLSTLSPGAAPRVNCAVGVFDMEAGRLESRATLTDTTDMRITGTGWADFDRERLAFEFIPTAKRAQFLSLATPVVARGSFDDFRTGVTAQAALGTIVRQATSVLGVPLAWIFQRPLPQDGSAACLELWRRARAIED